MKKYILLILLILVTPLFGADIDITKRPTSYWWTGNPSRDIGWNWAKSVNQTVMGSRGTGQVFYVDSNVANEGDGRTITGAKDTIEEGIQLLTANQGDILYVLQGHVEDGVVGTANMWDADIAGSKIIGLGEGSLSPRMDFNFTSNTCVVGADNISITNIRFRPSIASVAVGLTVEAGSDFVHIYDNEFGYAENPLTDEFLAALKIATSTGGLIEYNFFDSDEEIANAAITIDGCTNTTIRKNTIFGDYAVACISNALSYNVNLLIEDNLLVNGVPGGLGTLAVVSMNATTFGINRRNYAACNVATANLAFVGTKMYNFGNYYIETAGGSNAAFNIDLAYSGMVATPSTGITTGP